MSSIDYRAELTKAGANVDSRWAALRFLARRYPLGAAGAVIMAVCVFAALFANYITVYDPLSTNAALSLARPPSAKEKDAALTYVKGDPAQLNGFTWLLFNLDEFSYAR